jgi:ureidoglycolate hydrolase
VIRGRVAQNKKNREERREVILAKKNPEQLKLKIQKLEEKGFSLSLFIPLRRSSLYLRAVALTALGGFCVASR